MGEDGEELVQRAFGEHILAGFKEGWKEMMKVDERAPWWAQYGGEEGCDTSPFCPGLLPSIHSCFAFESKAPGEENDYPSE